MQKLVCFFLFMEILSVFSAFPNFIYYSEPCSKINLQSIEQIRSVLSDLFLTKFISLLRIQTIKKKVKTVTRFLKRKGGKNEKNCLFFNNVLLFWKGTLNWLFKCLAGKYAYVRNQNAWLFTLYTMTGHHVPWSLGLVEKMFTLNLKLQMVCWYYEQLRVRAFFHKTVRVCHVYCNFKIGFTCRISVIFGTLKDGSLLINTLASNICFSYRNMFQNGVDALSKIVDAFLSKSLKFYLVRIIR